MMRSTPGTAIERGGVEGPERRCGGAELAGGFCAVRLTSTALTPGRRRTACSAASRMLSSEAACSGATESER